MRVLEAAPQPDFDSYIHREDTKCIVRGGEDLDGLYGAGYLPYSGTKGLQDIFYSARSARVALPDFSMTSENRRIARRFDGQFQKRRIPGKDFAADEAFYSFVLSYFAQRHGAGVMPRERLDLILASGLITDVMIYHNNSKPVAYALEVRGESMAHYWYSAYDLSLAKQSLGLWLMLDCIRDAAAAGLGYYYLGTVYGQKALYKTNFGPLEWHDGSAWSRDLAPLKEKSRQE